MEKDFLSVCVELTERLISGSADPELEGLRQILLRCIDVGDCRRELGERSEVLELSPYHWIVKLRLNVRPLRSSSHPLRVHISLGRIPGVNEVLPAYFVLVNHARVQQSRHRVEVDADL